MSKQLGRHATKELTRIGFVLSPSRGRRRLLLVGSLIVAGAAALGAGASYLYWSHHPLGGQQLAAALLARQQLQQRFEQTNLTLRMSEARGQELERQIDALNQRLRVCQEDLAFFRKAKDKDGKR